MATFAEILAARHRDLVQTAGLVDLSVKPDIPKSKPLALPKMPDGSRRFVGSPNAKLWFGGSFSGKHFDAQGVYITDSQEEMVELRRMYGVVEFVGNSNVAAQTRTR